MSEVRRTLPQDVTVEEIAQHAKGNDHRKHHYQRIEESPRRTPIKRRQEGRAKGQGKEKTTRTS